MKPEEAIEGVCFELWLASGKFGEFKSAHEGLAVILEEYEELKAEVFKKSKKRDIEKLRKEAKHVATMGLRFMVDLT